MTEENVPSTSSSWFDRIPGYAVPTVLVVVPLLAAIASWISDWFYKHIIWQYYWGPIVADAEPGTKYLCSDHTIPSGIARACPSGEVLTHAGYNIVNTISWAVLLGVCVIGLAQLLRHYRFEMGTKLILGATAWVVTGSIFHVLQDSKLFGQPLEFFFITPPIYLMFAAGGIGSLLVGIYLRTVAQRANMDVALQKLWFIFAIFMVAYLGLWLGDWGQIRAYVHPVLVALYAAVTFLVARWRVERVGRIDPPDMVMIFSIGWFLTGLTYIFQYLDDPWPGKTPGSDLQYAFIVAPLLAATVTAAVYGIARWRAGTGSENAWAFMRPINLVLVFSQLLDGFATAIGVDLSTYTEKHVLSEKVRSLFQGFADSIGWDFGSSHPTWLAFVPLKLAVSLLVVWAMDVGSKEDAEKYPTLIGLVKFAIIMVGIGPGVRNMLRMSLGI